MSDKKTQTLPPTVPDQEELATTLRKISDGFDKLRASGLKRSAIVVLLKDATGVGKKQIEKVLDGLANLAKTYTTKVAS